MDTSVNGTLLGEFISNRSSLWKSFGYYNDDYLRSISKHWFNFKPESDLVYNLLAGFDTFVTTLGLWGNFVVLCIFVCWKFLRTSEDYLIFNFTIAGFLMLVKNPIAIVNGSYYGPVLGEFGCEIYALFGGLFGLGSTMSLVVIAYQTYSATDRRVTLQKKKEEKGQHGEKKSEEAVEKDEEGENKESEKKKEEKKSSYGGLVPIAAIWVYAGFFSIIPFCGVLGINYTPDGMLTICGFDYWKKDYQNRLFILTLILSRTLVPLNTFYCFWTDIVKLVREKDVSAIVFQLCRRRKDSQERYHEEYKINMVLKLIFVWLVTCIPYEVVAALEVLGFKDHLRPLWFAIAARLYQLGVFLNSLIILFNHPYLW